MASGKRLSAHVWPSLLAGVLVLGVAACGDKPSPKPVVKPVPLAVQPEPPKEEIKMAVPQPGPSTARAATPANPDEALAAKVKEALGADGSVNVHRIDVTAGKGVITLYGTADTAEQRAKAERVAAGVAGVKSVENKLAIVAGS